MALLRPDIISALRDRAKGPSRINEGQRPLSFHKPLESGELDAVERRLGFALPAGVRQIYGEVANGGFGPGYGLIGLAGGALSDLRRDAVDEYLIRCEPDPHDQGWAWPPGHLANLSLGLRHLLLCRLSRRNLEGHPVRPKPRGPGLVCGLGQRESYAGLLARSVASGRRTLRSRHSWSGIRTRLIDTVPDSAEVPLRAPSINTR